MMICGEDMPGRGTLLLPLLIVRLSAVSGWTSTMVDSLFAFCRVNRIVFPAPLFVYPR